MSRLSRVDRAVLDENSNVRVRFLVSIAAAVFGLFLLLIALVAGAFALVHGYVPGVVVAGVLFVVAVLVAVAGAAGMVRRS